MGLGTRYHGRGKIFDSALAAPSATSAFQTLNAANYALLVHVAVGSSALFALEASPNNGADWVEIDRYTALVTTGAVQVAGYFPWVRASIVTGYNAATANAWYTPGLA